MILPVVLVGIAVSGGLIAYLSPPMIQYLEQHFQINLKLASRLGVRVCEGHFNDLLNMRLEDHPEMNAAMKKQAVEEIKALSRQMPPIQMIVMEGDHSILGSSIAVQTVDWGDINLMMDSEVIGDITVDQLPARGHIRYFPFWDWTIISFVHEKEYQEPIFMAKMIVYLTTISVFIAVLLTLVIVFFRLVNNPLKRLIRATEDVIDGKLVKVNTIDPNELGRLTASFNNMVESLDREKAEVRHLLDELKQSENRFRTLFEHAPVGICVALPDGKILETNRNLQVMTDYSKAELKNQSIINLFQHEETARRLLELFDEVEWEESFESAIRRRDGSICQARITIAIAYLDERKSLIVMAEDITSHKKLESQLQHAQKMEVVGTLAGGVAHDLNNILSGLVSYPELLLMKLPQDSPLKKPIITIQKSGLKAAAIVQDLLTLARRGVTTREIVNLNDFVNDYFASPEFEKMKSYHPDVTLEIELEGQLANIFGSPVQVSKTLMNLVSNAAEAIENAGIIKVHTENRRFDKATKGFEPIPAGEYVVLTVTDTGIGLSAEDQERIFEPFYTKKKMGRSGTGLGMTVVWGTIKDHDGFIDLTSSPGSGTRISLYFPASDASLETEVVEETSPDYKGKGETVMVVDDIKEQRELLEEILEELDYQVILAKSGEEAVDLLRKRSVDLVVLDMIMDPGMDGIDTYKAITALYPGQKAIITSGYSEPAKVSEAKTLGIRQYIKKPFSLEEVGLAIRKELDENS